MYVKERFVLDRKTKDYIRDLKPPFGYDGFGEFIFYRTYSRTKADGSQENWADVCIRVTEGTFSIRKDWYIKNYIQWNDYQWQQYAKRFIYFMFMMKWLPPGRGLWAMGTDFIYERGGMALNNCSFTNIKNVTLDTDLGWLMDSLMLGCGVGFCPVRDGEIRVFEPIGEYDFIIPDTREGWVESVVKHINCYIRPNQKKPNCIYDRVRPAGLPIKGFGGISSGPEPLKELHNFIDEQFQTYRTRPEYDEVWLKTNLANLIGCCVVAGNVRRSAELAKGSVYDSIFMDLKNYDKFPDRKSFGWMSNNSVELCRTEDFDMLGEIASRVIRNGEPGYINRINMRKGRINPKDKCKEDLAEGFNPCITGETKILLADGRGYQRIDSLLGTDALVHCISDKDEVVVRKMRNIRKTGEQKKILKVVFDDGNSVRVTENHKIMLRDRTFKEAKQLVEGDSVAIVNKYIPVNCDKSNQSRFYQYINIGYGRNSKCEHILINEYLNPLYKDLHTHHVDGNKLNNIPSNLELRESFEHLSNHSVEDFNANYSGVSNEHLLSIGVALCERLGHRFSRDEWRELGVVQSFSQWRKSEFGSWLEFAYLCADMAHVINEKLDTRTLRFYNQMLDLGYETDIRNGTVFVTKTCEACKKDFEIEAVRREQACCSHSCNNTLRDYSKSQESNRQINAQKAQTLRLKQLDIYCDLQAKLGRAPKKEEWQIACKEAGVSVEISRVSSPFRKYSDLQYAAKSHNHKVVAVFEDGFEDVYNGTVDEFHNFVIGGWQDELPSKVTVERGIVNANCGEMPQEDKETCNVVETCPTVCESPEEWYEACEYATMYASTVSLLPTHQPETNRIVARNRRIGVSIIDFTGWIYQHGVHKVTKYLRTGYKQVRSTNKRVNEEAGVPVSVRVTTVKPGGTTPKLPGRTPGMGYPTFHETLRRVKVAKNNPIVDLLRNANVPYEDDYYDKYTYVFEWPIKQGPAKPAYEISLWQQAMNLILVQREWSDNAVANTLYFKPKWKLIENVDQDFEQRLTHYIGLVEARFVINNRLRDYKVSERYKITVDYKEIENTIEGVKIKETVIKDINIFEFDPLHEEDSIEPVLSAIAPHTKSVSLLPHSAKGAYRQMPEEGISPEEYQQRLSSISKIDWSQLRGSDGMDERYCVGPQCELPQSVQP